MNISDIDNRQLLVTITLSVFDLKTHSFILIFLNSLNKTMFDGFILNGSIWAIIRLLTHGDSPRTNNIYDSRVHYR